MVFPSNRSCNIGKEKRISEQQQQQQRHTSTLKIIDRQVSGRRLNVSGTDRQTQCRCLQQNGNMKARENITLSQPNSNKRRIPIPSEQPRTLGQRQHPSNKMIPPHGVVYSTPRFVSLYLLVRYEYEILSQFN